MIPPVVKISLPFFFLLLVPLQSYASIDPDCKRGVRNAISLVAGSSVMCLVDLRAIRGAKRADGTGGLQLSPGHTLMDIKGQLDPLPYRDYSVLDAKQGRVQINKPAEFALAGGHKVTVVPHQILGKRVQSTVNWTAPNGENIVSTKIRLVNGHTMVVGTDSIGDSSTIMSIKVTCPGK